MPQESGSPSMFNWLARANGRDSRRQWIKSREWWIWTPGNHSKVDVAM